MRQCFKKKKKHGKDNLASYVICVGLWWKADRRQGEISLSESSPKKKNYVMFTTNSWGHAFGWDSISLIAVL